jgi:hypothetical protein
MRPRSAHGFVVEGRFADDVRLGLLRLPKRVDALLAQADLVLEARWLDDSRGFGVNLLAARAPLADGGA